MAELRDGWIIVPYGGSDMARVEIGVGQAGGEEWRPAFLDWVDGQRVAKVRPLEHGGPVWIRVNGTAVEAGAVPGLPTPAPATTSPEPDPERPAARVPGRLGRR